MESIENAGTGRSRTLFDHVPAAIYTCDENGFVNYYNEAASAIWGLRPELGKEKWTCAHKMFDEEGLEVDREHSALADLLRTGEPIESREIVIERPDGKRAHVLQRPRRLVDESGKPAGGINVLTDITDLKESQAALRESESRYRQISENLEFHISERTKTLRQSEERYHKMVEEVQDYAILLLDRDGNILNWNRGAEHIKGYTEKEILGRNFRLFYRDSDRKALLPEKLINEAIEKGKASHEGWRVRKDGTQFWGNIVITALHDEQQNVIGFSKVTRDLTEKKLSDDRERDYARDIEFQNRQLESYAYAASHDLQEPLRKIRIFSEMLSSDPDDITSVKRLVKKINESAARMSDLIRDMLAYSQASQSALPFSTVDLNEIMDNVRQDYELIMEEKNVRLKVSGLETIRGIPVQLRQMFANLLSNAIKFSEDTPVINITGRRVKPEGEKEYLEILFSDNGVGFEPEFENQVFELFKRLDPTKAGTGIGLSLCKKIVENHHGTISVSSRPGEGTEFRILLPIQ